MKHVTKEELVLFVPAHVLPLVCPKRVVTTIHDLGGLRFPAGYSWFERWYARLATRLAIKKAIILSPSEFVRQEINHLFIKNKEQGTRNKIEIITNAYDREMFRPVENKEGIAKVLQKYQIRQPYFLSISRLEEKKNTAGIIEAFGIFKEQRTKNKEQKISNIQYPISEFNLVLLGKPGYGFNKVKRVIESSEFKNNIILPGWVATEDVPYLMVGATAFIFPSFYEGFGIPILEAMACGVPMIASNRSALPEVADGAALLVNPYKPAEIAEAMKQLVSSLELRQKLVERGLERVKNFSWEKTAQEVWDACSDSLSFILSFIC